MGKTPAVRAIVHGIDLFCGAGGLSMGLRKSGVSIIAGIDSDPICEYPFVANNCSKFIRADIRDVSGHDLSALYPTGTVRLLAGCAPCRPFSPFRRGRDNSGDEEWGLLTEFSRLARELEPDLLTMENVPGAASKPVFHNFVASLRARKYYVAYESVYCPRFGVPQHPGGSCLLHRGSVSQKYQSATCHLRTFEP